MHAIDRHRFLASAIVGRSIAVQESDKEPALAFSDGRTIFVPKSLDGHSDLWRAITAQAALIAAGSLRASLLPQLVGRRAVAQRYVYLEVVRSSHVLAERLPLAYTERAEFRTPPRTDSAEESLALASTRSPLPAAPAYFGTLRPLMALKHAIGDQGFAALSNKRPPGGATAFDASDVPELEEDAGESSAILRLLQNPFAAGNPLGDLLNGILGAGTQKGKRKSPSDGSAGAEIPVGRVEHTLRRGINAVLVRLPAHMPDPDETIASPTLKYPEWNAHSHTYRRDWVSFEEVEAARPEGEAGEDLRFEHPSHELRRQLATLGLDQQLKGGQSDGSDLDFRPIIDCAIDLRAGHSPASLNVYRASSRTRRDLAVNVIVDISGSTGERRPDGHSAFTDQVQLAYQLGFALDSLGDTVAMMGFHSWGRGLARVVRIKNHDERWSLNIAERLRMLHPVGYTRIGAAIRHGYHVLNDRIRLPNRLLILLTDAVAYDRDYELNYAAADARKALEEARNAGTACIALSVGAGTQAEDLAKIFGGANILAVDEITQVSKRIREVCRHALATVSKRRFSGTGIRQRPR